jgi:integrase
MTTELTTTTTTALVPATYPADRNPALVYLASLAPGSRRTQRGALSAIADLLLPGSDLATFPWGHLRYQHTQAIRSKLAEAHAPATANRILAALRSVIREAWRLGMMSAEDYQRAVDVRSVPGERAKQAEVGRHIQAGELKALLDACADGTRSGARDAAIIAIAYTCGLRRAEIAALTLADYDRDNQTLIVRRGKGNKERVVPLADGALNALADWLHWRGNEPGPLFYAINRGGHIVRQAHGIADNAIYVAVAKRQRLASVKTFSPHDLRRTFAGDLLDAGTDIVTVQQLMGHASVTTTAGYDRRGGRAKRDAVNKLHVPYRRQWKD